MIGSQGGVEPDDQGLDVLDALGVPDRTVAAPVGNSGFQADFYADKLGKSTKILELLPALHPHTAFLLLSQCVNARPAYLCRIVGPWSICGFLEAFDRKVDECLALIIGVQGSLPSVARILRGLPAKVGE